MMKLANQKEDLECEGKRYFQTLVSSSEIKGIQIKKIIAKLKKNQDKSYKHRPIVIVPILSNISNHNQMFIIHGFFEVETQYRDYSDPLDINNISYQDKLVSIKSIEKNTSNNMLIMNTQCNGSSGLKEFQFLIDYFSQQPDADFYRLSQYLSKYQVIVNESIKNQNYLVQQINQNLISKQHILKAIDDYQVFYFEQVKQRFSQDEFILACFSALNIETLDVEPRNIIMSRALLSLFGIEMNQEQELLHQSINLQNILGKERIEATISLLEFCSQFDIQRTFEQTFVTIDYINFRPQMEYQYIDWPQRPQYLSKFDLVGHFIKFNVPLHQLKSIIEIRKKYQINKNSFGILNMQDILDYQIQTEIFIEKFYPQLVKKQEEIKELSLRHLNKKLNKCL
ncbi:hypothetical protein ABPG74_009690 [Tetrahymena malaccensis]